MNGQEYWICLQSALGAGAKLSNIIDCFGSPKELFEAGPNEWKMSGVLSKGQVERLKKADADEAKRIIGTCGKNGWHIITPDSLEYPDRLRDLIDFPAVLYIWGELPKVDEEVLISIVGTRNATAYGLEVAQRLSSGIVKAGAIVVSGGALGIDSAAHKGALMAGGKTIAFLGCGLGNSYLSTNKSLRETIAKNGAVISEYPPFCPASKITFPIRNRLISGISLGTVIIEAGEKSGSLITADFALQQGKDVFAVPGSVISSAYTGTNKLIQDGAKPVFSAADVLDEYKSQFSKKLNVNDNLTLINEKFGRPKPKEMNKRENKYNIIKETAKQPFEIHKEEKKPLPKDMSDSARMVYEMICKSPMHVDEIMDASKLAPREVLSILTQLEMYGLIKPDSGRRYRKILI